MAARVAMMKLVLRAFWAMTLIDIVMGGVIGDESIDALLAVDTSLHFTSTDGLKKLLRAESQLIRRLEEYVDGEYRRLEKLKRLSKKHRLDSRIPCTAGNTSEISYQTRLFALSKRLSIDRDLGLRRMSEFDLDSRSHLDLPTNRDLHGAAEAIFRLQDTYDLRTEDLADGRIQPGIIGESMSADDCFSLGYIAYMEHRDYYHALQWFVEAYHRLTESPPLNPIVDEAIVLDFLSNALFAQGNPELAVFAARKLRRWHFPKYQPVYDSLATFEETVRRSGRDPDEVVRRLEDSDLRDFENRRPEDPRVPDREVLEALCRGEGQDQNDQHRLGCHFSRNHAFLRLAPMKVEVLRSAEPRILLFKNAISDREADTLKELAEPRFFTTEGLLNYRVSKSAWLNDTEHPIVEAISKRIELMTGLTAETAESLHVSNYGLGGHYQPHWDWYGYRKEDDARFEQYQSMGNRIATVLLYLSQPTAGGATVFLDAKLTVQATQNDAVFWYNLRHDGSGDERTRHAACPVLVGSKWIANKWLHEYGQEYRRPCRMVRG